MPCEFRKKESISMIVNDAFKVSLHKDLKDIKSWYESKDNASYGYGKFVEFLNFSSKYYENLLIC